MKFVVKSTACMLVIGYIVTSLAINAYAKGNTVKVEGTKGNWELSINQHPFRLKGVGVGLMDGKYEKADYLKLARNLGANIVRTWGVDQGTKQYLDNAYKQDLYVGAGIWLDPVQDGKISYHDEAYKTRTIKKILKYVDQYKEHPAILFWNIGNEVIFWTKDESERIAFSKFLEEIIKEVHRLDPDHPVVYTTAFTAAIPYIKEHVPSLDILGVNAYGGFRHLHQEVTSQLDIPYMITEFGPLGPWDRPKDMNGSSLELTDDQKSHYYKRYAQEIQQLYGYCLGGFVFFLGDTTQVSHTWWNLTHGDEPKHAYLTIKEFYTGKSVDHWPPVIKDMHFSKRKDLQPGEKFDISLDVESDSNSLSFEYFATTGNEIMYFDGYPNKKVPLKVIGHDKTVTAKAPSGQGIYRIYAIARDGLNQVSVFNKSISVKR